jgi:hypothetical protein
MIDRMAFFRRAKTLLIGTSLLCAQGLLLDHADGTPEKNEPVFKSVFDPKGTLNSNTTHFLEELFSAHELLTGQQIALHLKQNLSSIKTDPQEVPANSLWIYISPTEMNYQMSAGLIFMPIFEEKKLFSFHPLPLPSLPRGSSKDLNILSTFLSLETLELLDSPLILNSQWESVASRHQVKLDWLDTETNTDVAFVWVFLFFLFGSMIFLYMIYLLLQRETHFSEKGASKIPPTEQMKIHHEKLKKITQKKSSPFSAQIRGSYGSW